MIYVGIDVAKHKHDCIIIDSFGEILEDVFQIENNLEGFNLLKSKILDNLEDNDFKKLKVGLESTGHYSNNIINFLRKNSFHITIFNPLSTNLYRKAFSLRKTKTDKIDALHIATMLFSDDSKPYSPISYHISEVKSLARHRFRLVGYRSKLKISYCRIIDIIFPELSSIVWSINQSSIYSLLLELPNTHFISQCHLTTLTNILSKSSKGKYSKDKAIEIRNLAKNSIGAISESISFELQQTIRIILNVQEEIKILDKKIKSLMNKIDSPIMSIPGISFNLGSIIISEIGDINNFESPAKLLAFAGLEPSTHQSGTYKSSYAKMVKRGSKYLRWALLNAARLVSMRSKVFKEYLTKKRLEGKNFFVALSHVAKKLIRIIFHLLKHNQVFCE